MLPKSIIFHTNHAARESLREALEGHLESTMVGSIEALDRCLGEASARPSLVFVQLLLPLRKGLDTLRLVRERAPHTEVIALSPIDSTAYAVAVVKAGAFGFLSAETDQETLLSVAYEALERLETKRVAKAGPSDEFPRSKNASMKALLAKARGLPAKRRHVVLTGEVGTGRKTLAHALHGLAPSSGVLRLIDCGRMGSHTLESVLGLVDDRRPTTPSDKRPMDSTLCLLDLDSLDDRTRIALRRIAESPVEICLANGTTVPVRYRIVAIRTEPYDASSQGRSRTTRFQELIPGSTALDLPPLRHRMEDLELLCAQLSHRWARKHGLDEKTFSEQALEVFSTYGWPANLLELSNVIERLMLTCDDPVIDESTVPLELFIGGWKRGLTYREAMERLEREFLLRVLDKVGGRRRRAAERLHLSYSTLKFRLRKLDLRRESAESKAS